MRPGRAPARLPVARQRPPRRRDVRAGRLRRPRHRRRSPQGVFEYVGRRPGRGPEPAGFAEALGGPVPRGHRGPGHRPADRPARSRREAPAPRRCSDRGSRDQAVRADPSGDLGRAARRGRSTGLGRRGRVRRAQAGQGHLRPAVRELPYALRQRGKGRPRPDHLPPRRPGHHAPEHRQSRAPRSARASPRRSSP